MANSEDKPKDAAEVSGGVGSITRREVLVGSAATLACAFVPLSALAFDGTAKTSSPSAQVLTDSERQTLQAVVSRIIPADESGPGALEAGCAVYIETSLAGAYQSQKPAYTAGLAALNAAAISRAGKSFTFLTAPDQDEIVAEFEHGKKVGDYADAASFFEMIRRHTLEGMFGDPFYGGNANFAGWDLIGYPGARMYASPDMQKMDAKIPHSRLSAEQLMHGSR